MLFFKYFGGIFRPLMDRTAKGATLFPCQLFSILLSYHSCGKAFCVQLFVLRCNSPASSQINKLLARQLAVEKDSRKAQRYKSFNQT